jgi:hypothetical protein
MGEVGVGAQDSVTGEGEKPVEPTPPTWYGRATYEASVNPNLYSAPTAPSGFSGDKCPKCGSTNVRAPTFTWWGGFLGPKLFHHRVCDACRFTFNAKTGRSNKGPVLAYTGAGVVLGIAVGAVVAFNLVAKDQIVDMAALKRGCMKTCQQSASAAQCETGCSCFVHELQQMDPKTVRSFVASASSAKSLPPEVEAATKRCASAQRR